MNSTLCSFYVAISADVNVEIKSKSVWDSTNRNELETDLVSGYLVGLHNIPTRLLKMDKNLLQSDETWVYLLYKNSFKFSLLKETDTQKS